MNQRFYFNLLYLYYLYNFKLLNDHFNVNLFIFHKNNFSLIKIITLNFYFYFYKNFLIYLASSN